MMKKTIYAILTAAVLLAGCKRYEPVALSPGFEAESTAAPKTSAAAETEAAVEAETVAETEAETEILPERPAPTAVKGIYLAAAPVDNAEFMDKVIGYMDTTELNAVVIDVKDDFGRITYPMQNVALVEELGAVNVHINELPAVVQELKAHGVYCIARIVALKDPYIAEKKPEWALWKADGTLFRDNNGDAWVNPYKQEYWDYLLEVSKEVGRIGFDEIQFDYIRFCTERGIGDVVYDENDTKGRDKISIITELVSYLSENLKKEGLYVSCDVFGTIIGSPIDARSVGQDYNQMAGALDYICPMIYPSHYASGNFGLEHPDREPYACILGALKLSERELKKTAGEGYQQAVVRPWLQNFTASYLGEGNYMRYDADAIREQIRAVYDAGYDEWILWSASASYFYEGFLSEAEAEAEREAIEAKRIAEAETETAPEESFPEELQEALEGDDLSESDRAILKQDGDIVIYE